MRVRFKSAFYDGETFWPIGVNDIPDTIRGKKVIFAGDSIPDEPYMVLPKAAKLEDKLDPSPVKAAETPVALSELGNVKPEGFVAAMNKK